LKEKGVIDRVSVSIIKSSERSGDLARGFEKAYKRMERIKQKNGQIVTKLLYPIIVSLSSVLLAYFLVLLIFPKILPLFSSLKVPVPETTLFALNTVRFISNNIVYILAILFGSIGYFRYQYARSPKFKVGVHALIFRVPVLSKIILSKDSALAAYTLSILLKSGVPVLEAVLSVREDLFLEQNKIVFESISKGLQNGTRISEVLEATHFKGTDWIDFIFIAEKTGRLAESFEDLSNFYESELEETLNFITGISEPLLLLCVASVVLFIALSVVQPMYSIIQYVNP
jgi:type II secretory pathway component PulF